MEKIISLCTHYAHGEGLGEGRILFDVNGLIGELRETEYEHINLGVTGKASGWYPCLALIELNTGKWLCSQKWKLNQKKTAIKECLVTFKYKRLRPSIRVLRQDLKEVNPSTIIRDNALFHEVHLFDPSLNDREVLDVIVSIIDTYTDEEGQKKLVPWDLHLDRDTFKDPLYLAVISNFCGRYSHLVDLYIQDEEHGPINMLDCI